MNRYFIKKVGHLMYQIIEVDSNHYIRTVHGFHQKARMISEKMNETGFCGWTPRFMLKKLDLKRYCSDEI